MIKHAYIHIPFCIRKCHYCSFVSGLDIRNKEEYMMALLKQIKTTYQKENLNTLYLGGGTPSLLSIDDIKSIIHCFNYSNDCEITLEVNPETVEEKKFKELKKIGINRLSIGIQSFNNEILSNIGRIHNEETINKSIKILKDIEFNNISIDLIYGLPNQTLNDIRKDLNKAIKLDVQHISTYGLKIEDESYWGTHTPQNIPDDEQQAKMFNLICSFLKENNYIHYEISNFSKEGFSSKHNCAYWKNKNYYGFGQNASGYENNIRYRNCSNFKEYIKNPFKKEEENKLKNQEILEEEIFLALRLKEGLNIKEINKKFNIDFAKKYEKIIQKYQKLNLLRITKNHLFLTEEGFLLSNEIMSEFID